MTRVISPDTQRTGLLWGVLLAIGCAAALTAGGCSSEPAAAVQEQQSGRAADASAGQEGRHQNHLAGQTSPYLLLHADNPVDWYPWCEEALAKARRENKPIFLSIGYSSCHWCHVMERESFMDDEIAALLNKHFVCIKVDREERPDVDQIYMTALAVYQQLSGSGRGGGWPLSMFLTPEGKPFFGGTYFPARDGDRPGAIGFLTVVKRVQQAWQDHRDAIQRDAETVTRLTRGELEGPPPSEVQIQPDLVTAAVKALADQYDPKYGGFGYDPTNPYRPKFPDPSKLLFLVDHVRRTGNQQARNMLVQTLEAMARGGIRDHVGGGFHRYSVDRYWHIPHFEKMLYDNAQLLSVYSSAFALTDQQLFRQVAEETVQFVLEQLTDPAGAFYSSLDAESEGEEGKYYRWTREQVRKLLGDEQYKLFSSVYGLDQRPNFESRYYVLQLSAPLAELANRHGLDEKRLLARLRPLLDRLKAARRNRPAPRTDRKILTGWNGLMIRGLADAGRQLGQQRYLDAAERAARCVLERLRTDEGRLLRSYSRGKATLNAYLDDYAFLVDGLIALHQATGRRRWLDEAAALTDRQIDLFWDDRHGGFFFTSDDHQSLLARAKDPLDGALPSGNSVSAGNLVLLAGLLDKPDYLQKAEQSIRASLAVLHRLPAAAPRTTMAVAALLEAKDRLGHRSRR